ncbi:SEL1-like repeat protein [Simplicispira piscis]
MPVSDDSAQEKAMEKLRSTAQSTPVPPGRKGRPPADIASEPSPKEAAWLLGLLALHGKAMPFDPVQAQHWFERAYLLGNPLAAAGLAWCQMDGCGGTPNPELARTWIDRLRKVAPGRALYLEWALNTQLAALEIAQPGPLHQTPPNAPIRFRDLLLRAAQAGDSNALNELGLENLATGRFDLALRQFQAAARQSDAAANNARLLTERIKLAKKPPGAGSQTASAWWLQARRYHRGEGVPANFTEAMRLYQLAAAHGSREARHMLELISSRPGPQGGIDIAWMQQLAMMETGPDGTLLPSTSPARSPLFGRDPTPLYDFLPKHWRTAQHAAVAPGEGEHP